MVFPSLLGKQDILELQGRNDFLQFRRPIPSGAFVGGLRSGFCWSRLPPDLATPETPVEIELGMGTSVFECRTDAASAPLSSSYRRREPEKTVLYALVAEELATFRARTREPTEGTGLPTFILDEFERYLECSLLSRDFARVRCPSCREEILVALSCKSRSLCPSCGARRMHDTATHLVDRVLPHVPFRQWMMSWPKWLRPLLARNPELASALQQIFLDSIFVWQRRQARALGLRNVGTGSVTFSQRGGDSLNLNPQALYPA